MTVTCGLPDLESVSARIGVRGLSTWLMRMAAPVSARIAGPNSICNWCKNSLNIAHSFYLSNNWIIDQSLIKQMKTKYRNI